MLAGSKQVLAALYHGKIFFTPFFFLLVDSPVESAALEALAAFASGDAVVDAGACDELEAPGVVPAAAPELLSVDTFADGSAAGAGAVPTALGALPGTAAAALLSSVEGAPGGASLGAGTCACGVRGASEVGCALSSTGVMISAPTPVCASAFGSTACPDPAASSTLTGPLLSSAEACVRPEPVTVNVGLERRVSKRRSRRRHRLEDSSEACHNAPPQPRPDCP